MQFRTKLWIETKNGRSAGKMGYLELSQIRYECIIKEIMMAVFKMDRNFEIILNPEAIKLVPELIGLNQDQLRYVVLVADYVDGPYRKKPKDERRNMAKKVIWGDIKKMVETEKIRNAMKGYRSLVFDIRRETIEVYTDKVRELQTESLTPNLLFSRMKDIDNQITFLQDRIVSINYDLDVEEGENIEIKGKKVLSYIEQWQRNQREWHKYHEST